MSDQNPRRTPLYYTYGNHMHWVDMQWLWGHDVLPGSVSDMISLCENAGVKGNVNFDVVGYERLASECPRALATLRTAIESGQIEPVGCTYGQPYGLFVGGESNVRQLTEGVRVTRRMLGVFPRTFWEEEFYFLPQLPQMLVQCGYTGACLFFQWTWHTPEMPMERERLILWEGADGSRLPALPRNEFNIHQWPEEFDGLLDRAAAVEGANPAIVQWLELMPSRDWMCRSELLLPRLKDLMADPRFEVRAATAGEMIAEFGRDGATPVRPYGMDDVWHGVSMGKNADEHLRLSAHTEGALIAAESSAAMASLFGRPYAQWDVYPTWELEEAWRELLIGQHHDNVECEGLCGDIGKTSFKKAHDLGNGVLIRTVGRMAGRIDVSEGSLVAFNATGTARDLYVTIEEGNSPTLIKDVPPFGYRSVPLATTTKNAVKFSVKHDRHLLTISRDRLQITIDKKRGVVTQVKSPDFPEGALHPDRPLGLLEMMGQDGPEDFGNAEVEVGDLGGVPMVQIARTGRLRSPLVMGVKIAPFTDSFELSFMSDDVPPSQSRMHSGLRTWVRPAFDIADLIASQPYGSQRIRADGVYKRKYPTGDWMTSPQVFEEIRRPFTAHEWLDLVGADGRGLLIHHDGAQQWFREDDGVCNLLSMHDAWDEDNYSPKLRAKMTFYPHGQISGAKRAQIATLARPSWNVLQTYRADGECPRVFGSLEVCNAPGVVAQAFFRESMRSGENLPDWAGHRMREASQGACTHPFVIRLVEWAGEPAEVELKLPGEVAMVAKTNLLGEVREAGACGGGGGGSGGWSWADTSWLTPEPAAPPDWARGMTFRKKPIDWSVVRFTMRPREIATVMADLVMGRKVWRDLDAKRKIWATVHKQG